MGIEQQIQYNSTRILYGTHRPIIGQRLGIPSRRVDKLAFVLERINLPVGDVFFVIARTFDNHEFVRQRLCDASEVALGAAWYELSFTTPPTINDEVTIYVEYLGGDAGNHILVHYQNTNVKQTPYYNEYFRENPACWYEQENWDCAYRYEYEAIGGAGFIVYSIEQLCQDLTMVFGDATVTRNGQKLTIPNRIVTHLGFWLEKIGNPIGDITFGIRRVSDDSLICSKVWGDALALPFVATYEEVEFDSPPTINEEVRVYAEFLNGDALNQTHLRIQTSDVKGNEHLTFYSPPAWSDFYAPPPPTRDCTYRMKNLLLINPPIVQTDPATEIT